MLEIEIKAHCADMESVKAKLGEMGASLHEVRDEADLYFNHPSRDFRKTDEAFRIRSVNGQAYLTYKGPKLGTRSKTRFEEELGVESRESMRVILEKLGFIEVREVHKHRELYHLQGFEVCLDLVEGLGSFVEIEQQGEDRERVEKELFELAARLGLERFETRAYLEMLENGL